jgi:TonB family protein
MPLFTVRAWCYIEGMRTGVLLVLLVFLISCSRSAKNGGCDFADYRPYEVPPSAIRDEHPFFDPRTHWAVKPFYPPEAVKRRLSGTVHVRLLIDVSGHVVKACAVYPASEPKPDESLVSAAVRTAEKARFRPNFGQPAPSRVTSKYAATTLDLRYTLTDQHP